MITGSIEHYEKYTDLHPRFKAAFEYLDQLRTQDFSDYEQKVEIDGKKIFAINAIMWGRENMNPEIHRKYIDIQFVRKGEDEIRFMAMQDCKHPIADFDVEKDIQFFSDKAHQIITLSEGDFVILFPDDAHAPLAGNKQMYKSVIKVQV